MNKTYLLAVAAIMMAAPAALAHEPAGTPRNYCEDAAELASHDYASPGTGNIIFNGQDGNIAGDCNGDTVPADYDGHIEYANGGGWLSAESGDGVTTGSIYCFGEVAHHPFFGPISVNDIVNGGTQAFFVASDTLSVVPPTNTDNCGDFESDNSTPCVGSCSVTFPPGLDGTYQVYVGDVSTGSVGTGGHITTGSLSCGANSLSFVGSHPAPGSLNNPPPTSWQGGVTINFNVGSGRILTGETVYWSGGPAPNPNPITHNEAGLPTGPHSWTVGGSGDFLTREFTYEFYTLCLLDGSTTADVGTVEVYN